MDEKPRPFWQRIPGIYWRINWTEAGPWLRAYNLIFWGWYLYLIGCAVTPGVSTSMWVSGPAVAVIFSRTVVLLWESVRDMVTSGRELRKLTRKIRAIEAELGRPRQWTEDDL